MARRIWGGLLAVVASAAGIGLAAVVGSAGADTRAATTTTLGSTTGTPSKNICLGGFDCTYVPFSSAANPTLQVALNGSVTSFSVNSGSAAGSVQLRVLRPAGNGKFTGAGTSPMEPLATGGNTYSVSLPVQAGDVLALDNSSSAPLFDDSSANPVFTAYYNSLSTSPGLADGSTAAPDNNRMGFRLLLSAVVTGTTPTTSTGTTTGTNGTVTVTRTVTTTNTTTAPAKPVIGNPTQSRTSWTRKQGTTFAFGLSTSAKVLFVFRQRTGRHTVIRGTLVRNGHPGTDRVRFNGNVAGGKKLAKGRYTVTITAHNKTGTSKPVSLSFTITG